ncbi:MAG: adenylyl-sulfate kinase [Betaproteobacteria bacterium HGW-Betaproteobacteria-11]|nr:MAG: adenylyl-sulfate kinase [Betaproteobacteria bacterium HGW-Betaproteobacteria-11]
MKSSKTVWHQSSVSREAREHANGHRSVVLWFTGLSAAGKSTIAHAVEETLHHAGCRTFVLDGDNIRHGLCGDLGFSLEDRDENLRRVGEAAKLFLEAGIITLAAFISPLRAERERVRNLMPHGDFLEIYCAASLDVCEARDPKGLYSKARAGLIADFTGISSPYEPPVAPELSLDTGKMTIAECVASVMELLAARSIAAGFRGAS